MSLALTTFHSSMRVTVEMLLLQCFSRIGPRFFMYHLHKFNMLCWGLREYFLACLNLFTALFEEKDLISEHCRHMFLSISSKQTASPATLILHATIVVKERAWNEQAMIQRATATPRIDNVHTKTHQLVCGTNNTERQIGNATIGWRLGSQDSNSQQNTSA